MCSRHYSLFVGHGSHYSSFSLLEVFGEMKERDVVECGGGGVYIYIYIMCMYIWICIEDGRWIYGRPQLFRKDWYYISVFFFQNQVFQIHGTKTFVLQLNDSFFLF